MADPRALQIAVAAYQACHFLGMPECNVHLTQAVVDVAMAPKSNAMEVSYNEAKADATKDLAEPVPLVIRNGVTGLMRELEYGKGYQYAHDYPEHFVEQQYLPSEIEGEVFYEPSENGYEKEIREYFKKIKGSLGGTENS